MPGVLGNSKEDVAWWRKSKGKSSWNEIGSIMET